MNDVNKWNDEIMRGDHKVVSVSHMSQINNYVQFFLQYIVKWPAKYQKRYIYSLVCFLSFTREVTHQFIRNICDVYLCALVIRKFKWWFSQSKFGNFNLFDSCRLGRPKTIC